MSRQAWFDGLKDAEDLFISKAYTLQMLKDMIDVELNTASIDYHRSIWRSGFADYILNLEFRMGEGK